MSWCWVHRISGERVDGAIVLDWSFNFDLWRLDRRSELDTYSASNDCQLCCESNDRYWTRTPPPMTVNDNCESDVPWTVRTYSVNRWYHSHHIGNHIILDSTSTHNTPLLAFNPKTFILVGVVGIRKVYFGSGSQFSQGALMRLALAPPFTIFRDPKDWWRNPHDILEYIRQQCLLRAFYKKRRTLS